MTMNVMAEGPNGKRLVKNLVDPGAGEENGVASTEGDEEVVSEAPVHCCGVGMVDFSLWNIIVHHLMVDQHAENPCVLCVQHELVGLLRPLCSA